MHMEKLNCSNLGDALPVHNPETVASVHNASLLIVDESRHRLLGEKPDCVCFVLRTLFTARVPCPKNTRW